MDSPVVVKSAGTAATIMRHKNDKTIVKMPYGREYAIDRNCYATVGRVSNPDLHLLQYGSAQMHRRFGYKMSSG